MSALGSPWYVPDSVKPTNLAVTLWLLPAISVLSASEPIRQTYIGPVSDREYLGDSRPLLAGPFTVRPDDSKGEILVEGVGPSGRRWRVYTRMNAGAGYSVAWLADLDGDGRQDLILNQQDLKSGRCTARSRLTTILFDREGRPAPWEAEGYYRVDFSWEPSQGKGVLDFADWNSNGGVELVFAQCYSYHYQSAPTNVYGLVDVYEARGRLLAPTLGRGKARPREDLSRRRGPGLPSVTPEARGAWIVRAGPLQRSRQRQEGCDYGIDTAAGRSRWD